MSMNHTNRDANNTALEICIYVFRGLRTVEWDKNNKKKINMWVKGIIIKEV